MPCTPGAPLQCFATRIDCSAIGHLSFTRHPHPAMSQPTSMPSSLDPEAGTPSAPSVSQAASDLRAAAGATADAIKECAVETAQHLRDVTTEKAGQFKSEAMLRAEELKLAASGRAEMLRHNATEQWQDTRVRAKELQITAEDYIRENPTKCVLTALGAGFLIGLIVRR